MTGGLRIQQLNKGNLSFTECPLHGQPIGKMMNFFFFHLVQKFIIFKKTIFRISVFHFQCSPVHVIGYRFVFFRVPGNYKAPLIFF